MATGQAGHGETRFEVRHRRRRGQGLVRVDALDFALGAARAARRAEVAAVLGSGTGSTRPPEGVSHSRERKRQVRSDGGETTRHANVSVNKGPVKAVD